MVKFCVPTWSLFAGPVTYVDNVSLGANSVDEAYKIYLESKEIFRKASMNLREWVSNSPEFLDLLSKNEVIKGDFVKVFSIHWNCAEDYLQINGNISSV